jgi:Short repeat of unknown function (DUF308)
MGSDAGTFQSEVRHMSSNKSFGASLAAGLDEIQDSWGWFVPLGSALVVLGAVCIVGNVTATLATVLAFGWLLIVGAVIALVQAFRVRTWSGFFLYLLSAVLRGVTGYLLIRYPLTGEMSLTLVLASFFTLGVDFIFDGTSLIAGRRPARGSHGSRFRQGVGADRVGADRPTTITEGVWR